MAGPIAIDTPDYQRGVVSAQKLLATVPAGTNTVTVGLPPNVETLVVFPNFPVTVDALRVVGTVTGFTYPGVTAINQVGLSSSNAYYFDVSPQVDETVKITIPPGGITPWYVVADSASRITLTASMFTSAIGVPYFIPSAPSNLAGDHPPVEMQCTFNFGNGTQTFMNGPGVGFRYRLFTLELTGDNTAGSWEMTATGNLDGPYIHVAGVNATVIPLHPQGYPMPANTGLTVVQDAAGGTWRASVWHTTEAL